MRPPLFPPAIVRLAVTPDPPEAPDAVVGPRPRGSRRPHADVAVAAVRRLIEETVLTYGEIARRTGVGRASICRWTRDRQWKRPPFAPRATDTVPRPRASAQLKRRLLAARLSALAERYVRELEETPGVDLDKLAEALELLKMAKLAARPRGRRGERTRPILQLCVGGVELSRAPRAAVEDFLDNRAAPPLEERAPRRRGRAARRAREHAWLLEKE